jgi:hypothetical protein
MMTSSLSAVSLTPGSVMTSSLSAVSLTPGSVMTSSLSAVSPTPGTAAPSTCALQARHVECELRIPPAPSPPPPVADTAEARMAAGLDGARPRPLSFVRVSARFCQCFSASVSGSARANARAGAPAACGWSKVGVRFRGPLPLSHNKMVALEGGGLFRAPVRWLWVEGRGVMDSLARRAAPPSLPKSRP